MANAFKGERDIELNKIKYPTIVNMAVISEFESETGKDFFHCAIKSINAMMKTRGIENPLDRAQYMTEHVTMKDACWLFYLAAKEANSQVEFGEIQEAVAFEGCIDGELVSYPILFASLTEFAIAGSLKKKTSTSSKEKHLKNS